MLILEEVSYNTVTGEATGVSVSPYTKGASSRFGRILHKFYVRAAFRPVGTLGHIF